MPLAPAIAAALTDHSAHPYQLTIGGVDYIVGRGGNAPAVPLDSLSIDQQGSGGVSSLECTLEDPSASIVIPDGTLITFWNLATNDCYFRGFIDHAGPSPFAGPGRSINITATGIEAALDWSLVGDYTVSLSSSTQQPDEVGRLVALLVAQFGVAGIYGICLGFSGDPAGDFDNTIGGRLVDGAGHDLFLPTTSFDPPFNPFYSKRFQNVPLRSMIETLVTAAQANVNPPQVPYPVLLTVDTMGRVRMFADAPGVQPLDYSTLVVSDTVGSTFVASNLEHNIEYGEAVHTVYVTGAAAASSGYFGDGTGIAGKVGATSTDSAALEGAMSAAAAFFARQPAVVYRGSFDLIDIVAPADVWPGSLLTLTDAGAGASGEYRIGSIKRTFNGDTENWTVTYGRLTPSLVQMVRRLTRSVLN